MENEAAYSEKSSGNRSSKPSSPHSWAGSGPLTPSVSHQDIVGAPLEPCYSIALGDREPRSSANILKNATSPRKKPANISLGPTHTEFEFSPRFLMTPRKTEANHAAFSLGHGSTQDTDSIDDIFGEWKDEGNQWCIGVLGVFNGIILNLLALVFAFLLPRTGRRRTWFCSGVLFGAFIQSATLIYLVFVRNKK